VAISPNGRVLASSSYDNSVKLWSLPEGTLLKTLSGHSGSVGALAISPDGRLVASVSLDYTVKLWSLPEGALVRTLDAPANTVVFSPDGELLVSGSWDKSIKLWSAPDGALLQTLQGHSGWVNGVAITPEGSLLISGSADRSIKFWSLPAGELQPMCLMDVAASDPGASGIVYSKDGIAYTLPCGSSLPDGAVCSCNCVPGTWGTGGGGGGGVCTCIPVTYYYPNWRAEREGGANGDSMPALTSATWFLSFDRINPLSEDGFLIQPDAGYLRNRPEMA
jgi:hypothetical protein